MSQHHDPGGSPEAINRWFVLIAVSLIYGSFGLVVATTAALVPLIQDDLDLSTSEMGLVLGAWQFVFIGASIPAGRAIDRLGPRRALTIALLIIVASGLGRALAPDLLSLIIAAGLLGVGAPLVSVGAPAVAATLFSGRRRRSAVAVYSTAPATGRMLGLFLPGAVLGRFVDDWRTIAFIMALLAAAALLVWIPASRRLDEVMIPGSGPVLADYVQIAKVPLVRLILILATLSFFFVHGVGQWLVAIIVSTGRSVSEAGLWATYAAAMSLVVSLIIPQLARPRWRRWLLAGAALVGVVALQGLTSSSPLVMGTSLTIMAWTRSGLVPVFVLLMMDSSEVGPRRTAAATGLFFTFAQIGGVAGPAVTGLLAQGSGSTSSNQAEVANFDDALMAHSVVLAVIAVVVVVGVGRLTGGDDSDGGREQGRLPSLHDRHLRP